MRFLLLIALLALPASLALGEEPREAPGRSKPVLSPGARAAARTIGTAQFRAARTGPAELRRALTQELARTQEVLRAGLPALATTDSERNRDRIRAQRLQLASLLDAFEAELSPTARGGSAGQLANRVRVILADLAVLDTAPAGQARRAAAAQLSDRLKAAEAPTERATPRPMLSLPAMAVPARGAPETP